MVSWESLEKQDVNKLNPSEKPLWQDRPEKEEHQKRQHSHDKIHTNLNTSQGSDHLSKVSTGYKGWTTEKQGSKLVMKRRSLRITKLKYKQATELEVESSPTNHRTIPAVLIGHALTIGSCKPSFRMDRLVQNCLHGPGSDFFFSPLQNTQTPYTTHTRNKQPFREIYGSFV